MVFTRCASSELPFGALREVVARGNMGSFRGKPGLSGKHAPDSERVEGSSGEC